MEVVEAQGVDQENLDDEDREETKEVKPDRKMFCDAFVCSEFLPSGNVILLIQSCDYSRLSCPFSNQCKDISFSNGTSLKLYDVFKRRTVKYCSREEINRKE